MSVSPADVSDDLFARLRRHFDAPALVELTASIAWENYRARFNRALRVESDGFSKGSVCALPAPDPRPLTPPRVAPPSAP
jgi:hypothetical protein